MRYLLGNKWRFPNNFSVAANAVNVTIIGIIGVNYEYVADIAQLIVV